jgi:CRP/FNR family transcriptional regulator, cyclic AMP receptor protein
MHSWTDAIGYLAALLLVLTFFVRHMIPLRVAAICSSLAWLTYGWLDTLYPIIALHLILLPVNSYRLWQALYRPLRGAQT